MTYSDGMSWKIEFTRAANKQLKKLPMRALEALRLLVEDLKNNGPYPGQTIAN